MWIDNSSTRHYEREYPPYSLSVTVHLLFGPRPCSYTSSNFGGPQRTEEFFQRPLLVSCGLGAPQRPPAPPLTFFAVLGARLGILRGATSSCFSASSLPYTAGVWGDAAPSREGIAGVDEDVGAGACVGCDLDLGCEF